jgi:hypothetical protein
VSHLRAAGWAGDNVVPADRIALLTEAVLVLTLQDEEHFLFAMVAVERALNLARRQDGQVVAEVSRADMVAYRSTLDV